VPLASWSPDLNSIDLLLSVAESGSVGKAASAHGISQPVASARLSRLERRVGLALLTRTVTGSRLTPEGEAFAAWAREVVLSMHALTDNVTALRQTHSARLRIAASLTVAEYLMPAWLMLLRRENPDLEVTAVVANSDDVCDRVRTGRVEVGFVEMPTVPVDLTAVQVGVDRLVFVAAPDYPAARAGNCLVAAELTQQPILLREEGSGTRATFLRALAQSLRSGGTPQLPHAVELGSTTTILATARAGGGVGVIGARAARADLNTGALVEVEVVGLEAIRPLNAVWMGRVPTPTAQLLISAAQRIERRSP
jgi:DNA-binding transcriptional LysR family regulator